MEVVINMGAGLNGATRLPGLRHAGALAMRERHDRQVRARLRTLALGVSRP
jgi:hypothetical protein